MPLWVLEWDGGREREMLLRCPVAILPPEVWQVLEAYAPFERGLLPVAGGLLDQSATFCQAIRLLRAEVAEWERKRRPQDRAAQHSGDHRSLPHP